MKIKVNTELLMKYAIYSINEINGFSDILLLFSKKVFELSKFYCPVKTGELKNSSKMEIKDSKICISYNTDYATYVHELINNKHNIPTMSKFLEHAFDEVYIQFKDVIPNVTYSMYYGLDKLEMTIYIGVEGI